MFMQMNRAKRGLTLKPGSPEGREIVRRLIETADVVIANLPYDALVKLGLDYDSLAAINPRIILATASAFGSEGSLASRVGFDAVGQAMSGRSEERRVGEKCVRTCSSRWSRSR